MADLREPLKNLAPSKSDLTDESAAALPTADAATTIELGAAVYAGRAQAPRSIGAYRLVREIGEGGMGQVWLAEQTAPVQRRVALKLIRGGMYDDSMLRRFQSERQSLAMMDHPSIAKVFDAGATPDGQPYFVMEYVPGQPITRYCDERKLSIRDRLELFIKTCEGVQHAHQKAIIHRDLKPANILVVEVDGRPTPRIIDFGLAKALGAGPGGEAFVTRIGGFVGTPGYMSPEQADPSVLDVDTRADVYSLGVILYVLLTGILPFDTSGWKTKPFDEIIRQLREEDAPNPSATLADHRAPETAAAERGTQPKHLARLLHGDLDWITTKAIEKDRARRYGTPSELAADIRRYLRHEPVVARPASPGYRLQKYVRRHRIAASVAATLVLLLVGFAAVQAAELRRITRERDRANRITDFMTSMFKVSDPSKARGNTITAREILDKASKEIGPGLSQDPELQAQMMRTMGSVYEKLGLYPQAQALLIPATDIQRRILGPKHPDTLKSMGTLGDVFYDQGRYAEAEKLLRTTLDTRRRVLGPEHPDTLQSMNDLGIVLKAEGRLADAEKLLRESLEIKSRVLGPEHPDTLNSMTNLADILYSERDTSEAEQMFEKVLEARRRVLGSDAPETLNAMNNLGNVLDDEGRHTDAEKLLRESLAIQTRVLGPEHPDTLRSMHNLGDILYEEGRYDEAEQLLRDTLKISRRVLGPEHPDTAASVYSLGSIALRLGKRGEALADLQEAVDHGLPPELDLGIASDPDLEALHGDPRFDAIVSHARERASTSPKPK